MIDERIRHWSNNPWRPIDEVAMEFALLKSESEKNVGGTMTLGVLSTAVRRLRLLEEIYGRIGYKHGDTLIERMIEVVKLIDS